MDNNFNIDENTMNKLNEMIKNGNVSDLLSNIPPEVMQNFSSMVSNQNNSQNNSQNNDTSSNSSTSNTSENSSQNSFNFSNIDMNTFMKMKNILEKMNNSNDPRNNLLTSLKPYLRDSKKEKLDQYANLINFAKVAELLKNDNKESK